MSCRGKLLKKSIRPLVVSRQRSYVSICRTISWGRSCWFVGSDEAICVDDTSAWVIEARSGVGLEAKGMEMFCSSENERVRFGSAGIRVSRVDEGDGEDAVDGIEVIEGAVVEG